MLPCMCSRYICNAEAARGAPPHVVRSLTRCICISRFFYASSACIYPENKQLDTEVEGGGLKEKDAWPAQVCAPQQPHSRVQPLVTA